MKPLQDGTTVPDLIVFFKLFHHNQCIDAISTINTLVKTCIQMYKGFACHCLSHESQLMITTSPGLLG